MPSQAVSLREYIEVRLEAMEQAVTKAEVAAEKRFESINEMRAMVTDAARSYMPRQEFEASVTGLNEKLDFLQKNIIPRSEYELEHKTLAMKVEAIDKLYLPRSENEHVRQSLIDKYDAANVQLLRRVDAMQKIIWIGMGVVATLQFIIGAVILVWNHQR